MRLFFDIYMVCLLLASALGIKAFSIVGANVPELYPITTGLSIGLVIGGIIGAVMYIRGRKYY